MILTNYYTFSDIKTPQRYTFSDMILTNYYTFSDICESFNTFSMRSPRPEHFPLPRRTRQAFGDVACRL